MAQGKIFCILFITRAYFTISSLIFHENTKVTFMPRVTTLQNEYFGYSTLLSTDGLYIGAPKAMNNKRQTCGMAFVCPLKDLNAKLIYCDVLGSRPSKNNFIMPFQDLREGMWFGAEMAFLNKDRLMITAPRAKRDYDQKNHLLHGESFLLTPRRIRILDPLADVGRTIHQAFVTDGKRKEYAPNRTHIYYYAHGQVGFSIAVTKMNTVILGAPGLLQWTGGYVSYSFNPNDTAPFINEQPIVNTYYTKDLESDDYFGYSVESGIFERNGEVLYVGGAPRYNLAGGKVLLFHPQTSSSRPLRVRTKILGPQIGSYFGASLCTVDINEDGLDDLLVGAPTFVNNAEALPYDQGAVFIYITKESSSGFVLENSGYVTGSESDGARFGNAIADLGDVNADGFRDIAIGAPWENDGVGAVYIYKGHANGLNKEYMQRIQPPGAQGFGWSISKGIDVDNNKCNDLAVGAFKSQTSYLFRCVPSMQVHALIKVPNAINLPHNVTTFSAMFCVTAPPIKFQSDVKLNLIGTIKADLEDNRATVVEDATYSITAIADSETCDQRTIYVNSTADLLKPLVLIFELQANELMKDDSTTFLMNAARMSNASLLKDVFSVQLMRDCGEDLFCSPWLNARLEAIENPYIPGTNKTFGVRLTVVNQEDPAYGLKVNISLPMHPKRIPSDCSFEFPNMTCNFPQPFSRNETIIWEIELEYNLNIIEDVHLITTAEFSDKFYRNITGKKFEELDLQVTPQANFRVSGKSMPNASMTVSRENLVAGASVSFKHYFEITNLGPSDWPSLTVHINIPEKTNHSAHIEGCKQDKSGYICKWSIPAMVSFPVSIPLQMDLNLQGEFLKENMTYNATSSIWISSKSGSKNIALQVTTTLILEPASIIWYIVIPCIFIGLLLLGIITWILHKRGFFLRTKRELLQREKELLLESETDVSTQSIGDNDDEDERGILEMNDDLYEVPQ